MTRKASQAPGKKSSLANKITGLSAQKRALLKKKLGDKVNDEHKATDGHTLIAHALKEARVTHVFSICGIPIGPTLKACQEVGIRIIGVRHQQGAVNMAMAHNYVTGRLAAVVILSAGPAITNAATGILIAKDNCWPLLVIGGRRSLNMSDIGSFQELDASTLYQPITKWAALVDAVEELPTQLARACSEAMTGRPGPVYLDIPEDVLDAETETAKSGLYQTPVHNIVVDDEAIKRAAHILLDAQRPAVIIGKGARWSAPFEQLRQLVEAYGIPFITSPMGQGILPDNHPLCYNTAGGLLQSQADAVLFLGARLDWTFRYGAQLGDKVKLIQVDIHKAEIGRNREPDVGIVGDIKQVLEQLLIELQASTHGTSQPQELSAWHNMLNQKRQSALTETAQRVADDSIPMSPHRMMKELRDAVSDAIWVMDGNISMAAAQEVLPSYKPASRFTAGSNGCMGVGIPFGIGAKLAEPEQPVIVICGDGAFGFSAMEMEVAVRYKLPLVIVVVNNGGFAGNNMQKLYFSGHDEPVAVFQPNIAYEQIMTAFGGYGEQVRRPGELRAALERALASDGPACLNVLVDPGAPYPTSGARCQA